jgi:hypothetical protein
LGKIEAGEARVAGVHAKAVASFSQTQVDRLVQCVEAMGISEAEDALRTMFGDRIARSNPVSPVPPE